MAYPQESFRATRFNSPSIISQRREAVFAHTLLYQLNVLKQTGRYDAFRLEWHLSYGNAPDVWPIPNHLFWDSDIAKWIESACYFLEWQDHAEIRTAVDELVEMIRGSQQPDGYINIHYSVVEPGKRFTNIRDFHELYNAGHLIEAALAHHQLYGNEQLLSPILKYSDMLCRAFGRESAQIHGYPGHPEVELALLRLFHRVQEPRYFELAKYFIEERGNPKGVSDRHFYRVEAEKRGDDPHARPAYYTEPECLWYYQAHKPIVEQESIEGHCVRAMYLLTAAADLVRYNSHGALRMALDRLWRNMTERKMYVTGGIGAIKTFEGFGQDFFLPQGTDEGGCYAETCAGIGVMMLAERLLRLELDNRYGDIMELCFYNAVLTGMSCDGKSFTYDNQLASSEPSPSRREEWFTCACCPPNVSRLLGSIGGYLWSCSTQDDQAATVNVHMFADATLTFQVGAESCSLTQETKWPWQGDVKFELSAPSVSVAMNIRLPGWADGWDIHPPLAEKEVRNGYLYLDSAWLREHPTFSLSFPMAPRFATPHPYTNQDTVSICRGPIVYCAEDVDNPWVDDHFKSLLIDPSSCMVTEVTVHDECTGEDYVQLGIEGCGKFSNVCPERGPDHRYERKPGVPVDQKLHLVPYYFRANRGGRGHMRVGIRHWR